MSNSRRKVPKGIINIRSEKKDKRIWHKRLRSKVRDILNTGGEVFPQVKDVSDPWDMAKDGKPGIFSVLRKPYPKDFRK